MASQTFMFTNEKSSKIYKTKQLQRRILLLLLIYFLCLKFCTAMDTITSTQFIRDPETIFSNGSVFKLGFFSPANSTNRYVGIWYNEVSVFTVVWVANRDKPLKDSSGTVTMSEDGNLLVLDGQREILWSSNVTNSANNSIAQLLDSGNLVLRDVNSNSGNNVWESFQQPSNVLLPNMILSTNVKTGKQLMLVSWKSPSDPSKGSFSIGIDPVNLLLPQISNWNGTHPYWRSGPWNGQDFIGIPSMDSVYLFGFNVANGQDGTVSASYVYGNDSLSNIVLDSQGTLSETLWDEGNKDWEVVWSAPNTDCEVYGKCGPFGTCNSQDSPICSCLRGYVPKDTGEWSRGNWSRGCVRRTQFQCERNNSGGGEGKEDVFLNLNMMKLPDFAEWFSVGEADCGKQCLQNCSCVAYAYPTGIGCMTWSGNLIDLQEFSNGGKDLYIRLAYSELEKKKKVKAIIATTVTMGVVVTILFGYFSWRWMAKRTGKRQKIKEMLLSDRGDANWSNSNDTLAGEKMNQVKFQELSLFNFERLVTATDNFHIANKLGQGGFGPVYKGKLHDGQEIAVKRLSRVSGQGIEEFRNEVVVISKLQHRNLVKLLGCCVEGEEKMLIYEYLPNKSLDAFIFDPIKQKSLDWRKRFNIIEGIGRGLLYLHRDSRLKIIHRDLKPSNILLDEELNPKISDFGMARIFGGNQDQANTARVVGTYGYMSPEYAMQGHFSEKSDVFSFGVLLLEIVSGRRNTSFYNDEHSLSLLGFAWKLWIEDSIVGLIDPVISNPCFRMEILRCINVGLLCVQEFAQDRPTISTVISMLNSEIADLPTPMQPAFTDRRIALDTESPQPCPTPCSINNVTITIVEGR